MHKNNKNLTLRKIKAIELLIAGHSVIDAAAALEVRRETVYTWLRQPAFIEALNEAKTEAMDRLGQSLSALGEKAVSTLDEAMTDPAAGPGVRVRAADIVLNRALAVRDAAEFEKRLSDLEKQLNIRS